MPNAQDMSKPNSHKIMVLGAAGSGKTALERTLPGKKFAYYFDPNAVRSVRGADIDYEEFLPGRLNLDIIPLSGKAARDTASMSQASELYLEWEQDFEQRIDDGFFLDYDWVIFDSITTFQNMVMDRVLTLNNRYGKWPEQADWTATMNAVIRVFRMLTSQKMNIYVTGHMEMSKDEHTGRVYQIPRFIGRLRQELPMLFDEVWVAEADVDRNGEVTYIVKTTSTITIPNIRCSLQGMSPEMDVTIKDMKTPEQFGVGRLLAIDKEATQQA